MMDGGRILLTNARVVLPDRVLDDGTVAVEDGRIAAIESRPYPRANARSALDLGGRFLMPGVVDLHSDGLE